MSAEFLLTSLVIIVTPGTGVLCTLAAGLSLGSRAGEPHPLAQMLALAGR